MTTACAAGMSRRHFRVANGRDGIEHIVGRLHEAGIDKVVLEAIGPYAQPVVTRLVAAGFAVGLVNPRRIKAFREAEGRRAYTDRLDAALSARFAVNMSDALRPVPVPPTSSFSRLWRRGGASSSR
jgi:transposase